jgi:ankyrin repeat protein
LRQCLAPSLRDQLNELPKSLDETYERVLKEIQSTNQGRHARRLLRCLAVALRPLRAEELAEVLAFDLDTAEEGVPTFHPEWRWENQEQAVLSACSSLIAIVGSGNSRVIQFSHFSVKEYLTSDRLAAAGAESAEISQYHILPDPAHFILAHACLGVLLCSDHCVNEGSDMDSDQENPKDNPLLEYAAKHWVSHAQVGNVLSHLEYAMETLFDPNKPYFLGWIRIVTRKNRYRFYNSWSHSNPIPLYYAALCGFYDLVQRLIIKYPEQVNHRGGDYGSPLVAALSGKHVRIANFLVEHGAHVHVRGNPPLCLSIRLSDDACVDAVQFLLRHGARVNAANEGFQTPLHVAATLGRLEVARILLEHGADADLRDDEDRVPLHRASALPMDLEFGFGVGVVAKVEDNSDRFHLVQLLLKHCADVDAQDCNGATPLHGASYCGQLEIFRPLLDHGANPCATDNEGRTPLHKLLCGVYRRRFSQVPPQNFLKVAELLLEHGVDVNAPDTYHTTPLHLVSQDKLIAQLLLDHGAKFNAKNDQGWTPLHLVSQGTEEDSADVVRLLLELGVDVNVRDKNQETPLHFACENGNLETMRLLVDHGAEVNAQNSLGQTPLHQIADGLFHHKFPDGCSAQLLLQRGADVNVRNRDQSTPLHLAACRPKLQTVQVLLEHGAEADARDADGRTPLHLASLERPSHHGDEERRIERLLLKSGVSVDARDKGQATPLHFASSKLNLGTAKVLLEHGANVNAENDHGWTPLHFASRHSASVIGSRPGDSFVLLFLRLLLKHGANVNARCEDQATPLHDASLYQDFSIVQVLFKNGADVNAVCIHGWNALHYMLPRTFVEVKLAKLLLSWGVDLNAQDKEEKTPLHLASYFGHVDITDLFLDHGARPNAEDISGETPLHQVLLGHRDYHSFWKSFGDHSPSRSQKEYPGRFFRLAQRLLERGADVNAQNKDHETALHLASRNQLLELARILLKHGADVNVKNSKGKSPLQLATGRKRKAMRRLLLASSARQA